MATGLASQLGGLVRANPTLIIPHINMIYNDSIVSGEALSYTATAAYLNNLYESTGSPLRVQIHTTNYTSEGPETLTKAFQDVKKNFTDARIVLGSWSDVDALAALPFLNSNNLTAISAMTTSLTLADGDDNYFQYRLPYVNDIALTTQFLEPLHVNAALLLWDDSPAYLPYINATFDAIKAQGYPVEEVIYTASRTHQVPAYNTVHAHFKSAIDRLQAAANKNNASQPTTLRIALLTAGTQLNEIQVFGSLLQDSDISELLYNQTVLFPLFSLLPTLGNNASDVNQTAATRWANDVIQFHPEYSPVTNLTTNEFNILYAQEIFNSSQKDPIAALVDMLSTCSWCNPNSLDVLKLITTSYALNGFQWPVADANLHKLIISTSINSYGYQGSMKLDNNGTFVGFTHTTPTVIVYEKGGYIDLTLPQFNEFYVPQPLNANCTSGATGIVGSA